MGLREKKTARTREQILDVAADLFLEHGYDETTMEQIAEAAEVAPSTLYRYFPSKDLLILGRLTEAIQLGEALRARPADEPVPQSLAATLLTVLDSFQDVQRFSELRHVIDISPVPRARVWDVFMQSRADLEKELAARMGRADDDVLVLMTARTTLAIFELVAERWWAGDHAVPRAELLNEVLRSIEASGIVLPAP
jgi:AcrR family transcriptional regulator